ncbi:MAG TPA: MFS transporter [Candidatus Acidoferrum sp.]|jgi:predicted MFS family arabinose efflux permease|nr:MFS transporter [Candidatus Acidoferrum sp.]
MFSRRLKTGYLLLEGLNSFATVYYFYYFYFFMQKTFGFDNKANLALAALNGASYALFTWWCGKFAQRFGYFTALKLGFLLMMMSLAAGLLVHSAGGEIAVMIGTVFGMSFTWPTLEALVSEGEPREGLQHMVGIYNVVWAATASIANFTGGAMLDKLGPQSLFYVPMAIQATQLGVTLWLESKAGPPSPRPAPAPGPVPPGDSAGGPPAPGRAKTFLRLAWLANPCAYIGINTLIAAFPGVAHRLGLSTMLAGFCCSVWCFARFGAFLLLWLWNGWHYRFRWLLLAYLALVGAFSSILLAPNLTVLLAAQLVFGGAVGLIYYSSLFYSMDVGETKGEHGGFHEAAIGLGNFAGPAAGAAALQFLPRYPNSGAVAVSLLLLGGLAALAAIWRSGTAPKPS